MHDSIPATTIFSVSTETASQKATSTPTPKVVNPVQVPNTPARVNEVVINHRDPKPTPNPGNTVWVRDRINALVALYRPTADGEALLHSLDLRQMKGEPGFFGSYGFHEWAGVGEAKPIPIMHELGHSYWGGFPVTGVPDADAQASNGERIDTILEAYHRDILSFMAQPPDEYELLRQRLRNLPGLSASNTEQLFHNLEADLVYATGGDLSLVPPILRKYWRHFLSEGPFGSWERAAGWFQSLTHDERAIAGKFLGFEHLDLRLYSEMPQYVPLDNPLPAGAQVLAAEDRQRLTDFALQFDLLLGDAQLEENFQFWRGYLQDKAAIYRSHPGHLESVGTERAGELLGALREFAEVNGDPESRAAMLAERIVDRPILVNFLPAADDRTLVQLFTSNPELPQGPTLQATASFVERLQRFAGLVEETINEGRKSPALGTKALRAYLEEADLQNEQDLRLFFDLLRGTDRELARRIVTGLDKETVRILMAPVPVQIRAIMHPADLLERLDVTATSDEADLRRGVTLLLEEHSGNYLIDDPFLQELYRVMAARANEDPDLAARLIANTPFPLEQFILHQPDAVSSMLSNDLALAANLIRASDAVVSPPARIIYRLIFADASLAATLVTLLDRMGETRLVIESLAYFGYDQMMAERFPMLPVSLRHDGAFLSALLDRNGSEWLLSRLKSAVALYRQRVAAGEVAPDFLDRYRDTLHAAATSIHGSDGPLMTMVESALN